MTVDEAIEQAKLHLRRDTWLSGDDWRALLNMSVQDFSNRTGILEADFDLTLEEGVYEYDVSDGNLYKLTQDPIRVSDGKTLTRTSLEEIIERSGGDPYSVTGTPDYCYPIGTFTLGVYYAPDENYDGTVLLLHGKYHPDEITISTSGDDELPFEKVDHPYVVLGALVNAERIDKDLDISQDIRYSYEQGIMAARHRSRTRIPGLTKVKSDVRR